MKRAVIIFGVLLVFVIALFLMTPMFISSDTVKDRILTEAENLTGRKMTFRGNTSVSFLPFLGIEISDVVLEDPAAPPNSAPFVRIEKLLGKLDTLSAFFGRADIKNFRFIRPQFNLRTNGSGKANWVFEKGLMREVLDAAKQSQDGDDSQNQAPIAYFGQFEIVDGVASYENTISGVVENFTNINGSVNWPNSNSAVQLDFAGIWQGEQLKFRASAVEPIKFITGGSSDVILELQSAPVNFNFSGKANSISDLHLIGEFEMQSPSANRMGEFLGVALLDSLVIGELDVAGKLEMTPNKAQLTEAAITLDGSRSVGAINISIDEKDDPKLDGTLAFDAINITKLMEAVSDNSSGVGKRTENSEPLRRLSLDLRVSSNTVSVYDLTGEDFAAALSVRDGNWALDVGNVSLFDGEVMAKIEAQLEEENPAFSINISGANTSFNKVASLIGVTILQPSGELGFKIDIKTSGSNRRSLIRNSTGSVEVNARNGQIDGINLTLLDSVFSQDKTRSTFDEIAGETEFDALDLELLINRGVAWISEGKMITLDHEMALSGNFDLLLGGMAIQAKLRRIVKPAIEGDNQTPETPAQTGEWNNFIIGGTFGFPLLTRWPTLPRHSAN